MNAWDMATMDWIPPPGPIGFMLNCTETADLSNKPRDLTCHLDLRYLEKRKWQLF